MRALNPNATIAQDLSELAGLLERYNLVSDVKPLYDASSRLYNSATTDSYSYECNLQFSVSGAIAGTIPIGISHMDIIFSIIFEGLFITDERHGNPVRRLEFDIELKGMNDTSIDLYSAWHLDKHIFQNGDGTNAYIHPEYHLTFGGNKMEAKGNIFGDCLIVPMPRLAHPPMDAILGIDFIIQNYIPLDTKKGVLADPKYREVVRNSHLRLWRPFYCSISSAWEKIDNMTFLEDFHFTSLLPFITAKA